MTTILKVLFPFCYSTPNQIQPPIVRRVIPQSPSLSSSSSIDTIIDPIQQPPSTEQPLSTITHIRRHKQKRELLPFYDYNKLERKQVKRILGNKVDEIELTKIIIEFMGLNQKFCVKCTQHINKKWVRMPCDHYIHRKCYNYHDCPYCHDVFV